MKKLIFGIALFSFVAANAQTSNTASADKKETKTEATKTCEKKGKCCKKSKTACAEKKEETKASTEKKTGAN